MTINIRQSGVYKKFNFDNYDSSGILVDIASHLRESIHFVDGIPPQKLAFSYRPKKWTVSQVLGHLADHRVLFLSRGLAFAREQPAPIPGADENLWAKASNFEDIPWEKARAFFHASGSAMGAFVTTLDNTGLKKKGISNQMECTLGELLTLFLLHEKHHINFLGEHYLK